MSLFIKAVFLKLTSFWTKSRNLIKPLTLKMHLIFKFLILNSQKSKTIPKTSLYLNSLTLKPWNKKSLLVWETASVQNTKSW